MFPKRVIHPRGRPGRGPSADHGPLLRARLLPAAQLLGRSWGQGRSVSVAAGLITGPSGQGVGLGKAALQLAYQGGPQRVGGSKGPEDHQAKGGRPRGPLPAADHLKGKGEPPSNASSSSSSSFDVPLASEPTHPGTPTPLHASLKLKSHKLTPSQSSPSLPAPISDWSVKEPAAAAGPPKPSGSPLTHSLCPW